MDNQLLRPLNDVGPCFVSEVVHTLHVNGVCSSCASRGKPPRRGFLPS